VAGAQGIDAAAMLLDHGPGDRQTQADAPKGVTTLQVALIEGTEDQFQLLRPNADARVGDFDLQPSAPVGMRLLAGANPYPAVRGVNLTALLSKFHMTCWNLVGSTNTRLDRR
jgi:hypothetical protein